VNGGESGDGEVNSGESGGGGVNSGKSGCVGADGAKYVGWSVNGMGADVGGVCGAKG